MKTAASLAGDLDGRISLIHVQVVPYPLPLEHPQVDVEFLAERLRALADTAAVPVNVQLYFGRDIIETLEAVLDPDTVLVAGSAGLGWLSREQRLVKRLLKHGHAVVLAEPQRTFSHPLLGRLKAFRTLSSAQNRSLAHPQRVG